MSDTPPEQPPDDQSTGTGTTAERVETVDQEVDSTPPTGPDPGTETAPPE